jgi:quercetin dioxygenase-like cupin family protein
MVGSGTGRMEMKGQKSVTLTSGAFALLPPNHVHQLTCVKECQLFVYSNVAFDIHYVDKAGKEISAADALKAVKETPATEMK